MRESDIQRLIQVRASELGARLWRNNVGLFKTEDGRTVKTGLANGSSDLIGFKPVTITPDMVGQTIAVFVSAEVKGRANRVSSSQAKWIDMVKSRGGIAGVVRSEADIQELLK